MPEVLKMCSRCAQWFPADAEHFYRNRSEADGLTYYCKPCQNEYKRRSDQRHRDKRRAYWQEYYAANREAILARNKVKAKRYYAENRDAIREYCQQYHAANRSAIQARKRDNRQR